MTTQVPTDLLSLTVESLMRRVRVCAADQFRLGRFLLTRLGGAQALPPLVVLQSLSVLAEQLPDAP